MNTTIEMYLTLAVFLYIVSIAVYRESVDILTAMGWSKQTRVKPLKVSPLHRPKFGRVIVKSYARQV